MQIVDSKLTFPQGTPHNNTNPFRIVVHHLEARGSQWTAQFIHDMHIREHGWNGIGYHYYIRENGVIYTGRPTYMIGAHAQGANTNSIGVVFEGDFMKQTNITDAQYTAFTELVAYLDSKFGKTMDIKGHREVSSSECPGKYFPLDSIKNCRNSSKLYKVGWIQSEYNGRWWYCTDIHGGYYASKWVEIDGVWYDFDKDGYVIENKWVKDGNGKWCYLKSGGYAARNEWLQYGGKWFHFDNNAEMETDTWIHALTDEHKWYYVGSNGEMVTGWFTDSKGIKYYANSDGVMQANCIVDGIELAADGVALK